MLEIFCLFVIGLFVGGYGTLVGIGGGPLIVPVLALWYKYPTSTVIATSLFVIFINTLSGSVAYYKEKRIDIVSGTKFGLCTIPFSLISVEAVHFINIETFDIYFGFFLLMLAVYIFIKPIDSDMVQQRQPAVKKVDPFQLDYFPPTYGGLIKRRSRKSLQNNKKTGYKWSIKNRILTDKNGVVYRYKVNETLGIILTATIGIFSTFLGIGGGFIQMPVLVYLLYFPVHIATATSHYITAINTLFTLIPFVVKGDILYRPALIISLGALIGAQVGARLSMKLSGEALLKFLIPVFVLMGLQMLFF